MKLCCPALLQLPSILALVYGGRGNRQEIDAKMKLNDKISCKGLLEA
jgi:hypothetical protein